MNAKQAKKLRKALRQEGIPIAEGHYFVNRKSGVVSAPAGRRLYQDAKKKPRVAA